MPTRETTFCSHNENSYFYNQVQYRNSNDSLSKVRRRALRRWKDECYQFAQETTLHGLKYITLKDAFTVRRLIWFSLTCTCLSIMSYQIIDRIIYYHSSPITVNVKVNYNRSLVFPSVTVCNQNAFKSSTASDNNWYQLIEAMYNVSANSFNTSALSAFNATDLKLSDIFVNAGHKKEDLIAGCTWEGMTCSHDDFQPILTDHGLCYTFKPRNIQNELMVSSSGSDHGLKLFLNVEQYEYMPGPNDAAGIKLLTYNQSDIPRVKELGISIPTGIHAFVGLQLLMIKNLHVPYGECQSMKLKHSTEYSTDACLIECLNDFFQKECGCRNYFIPSTVGSAEECSLEKYYSCYRRYYEEVHATIQDQCYCPTACQYSVFDPTVSYASSSEYAAAKKLSSISKSDLRQKVLNAREVTHRMEKGKFDLFRGLILNLKRSFDNVKNMFQQVLQKISIQLKIIDSIYSADRLAWNRKTILFKYQIYNLVKNFVRPRDAMEERTLGHLCEGFHEFVFGFETNLKHVSSNTTNEDSTISTIYTIAFDSIRSRIETAERAHANITQLYEAYSSGTPIFRYKFGTIPRNNNIHIVPRKLLAESLAHNYYARRYAPRLQSDIKKIISRLNSIKLLLTEVYTTKALNTTYMKLLSQSYIESCENFFHSKSVFYAECIERPQKVLDQNYEQFNQFISSYKDTVTFLIGNLNNLRDSVKNVTKNGVAGINKFISDLISYLHQHSTIKKDQLADGATSNYLLANLSRCNTIFQEIRNRGQNINDGWTDLMKKTSDIWNAIINDENMIDYYKYKQIDSFLVNFTEFQNVTNLVMLETRTNNDLRFVIGNQDTQFAYHFEALRNHLILFKKGTVIDEYFLRDNFLQIDVFYRQLSYEEIEQQEAYDIFALLCDIGGSMGLFIGASVMTIFEIFDFIINVSTQKALSRRLVQN